MLGLPDGVGGCLFDLDGVLTQTAEVHAAAWKEMFDGYLRKRAARTGEELIAFDAVGDYDEYIDGKPRSEGVRSFLDSRGVQLPSGEPSDAPDAETIDGLGNRKNEIVLRMIRDRGVEAYEGSVRYVRAAREAGLSRAVVSSSTNCRHVLIAAGIEDLFEQRIDGVVADREHLEGKARTGHVPGGRASAGRRARSGGDLRGRAGGRRGGTSRWLCLRGGSLTGPTRPTHCASTAPTLSSQISPSCSTPRDLAPRLRGRAVGGPRDRA